MLLRAVLRTHVWCCASPRLTAARSPQLSLPCKSSIRAMPAKPVVDLTLSDSDSEPVVPAPRSKPSASAAKPPPRNTSDKGHEADQRKRIMEHAQTVARKRQHLDLTAAAGAAAAAAAAVPPAAAGSTAAPGAAGTAEAPSPHPTAGGGNSLLAQLAREREARLRQQGNGPSSPSKASGSSPSKPAPAPAAVGRGGSGSGSVTGAAAAAGPDTAAAAGRGRRLDGQPVAPPAKQPFSLLTYNVWFQEGIAIEERMSAIGDIINTHQPTFICLQEVTPLILNLFASSSWWDRYVVCPAPINLAYYTLLLVARTSASGSSCTGGGFRGKNFTNSAMERDLKRCEVPETFLGAPVVAATSHLESPCGPRTLFVPERQQQAQTALTWLDTEAGDNVLWAGDFNWNDSRDGQMPLPPGWVDVWQTLHPGQPGFTYHSAANPMLTSHWPGQRLDRVLVKLKDWRPASITLLGTQPLPGVTYRHLPKGGGAPRQLPVLPSDHFGLLLKLEPL